MQNINWLKNLENAVGSVAGFRSIMTKVKIGNHKPVLGEKQFPRVLKIDDSFLKNQSDNIKEKFQEERDFLVSNGLDKDDFTAFHVAQKFGWRAPVDAGAESGTSWFDQYRIEEAIAACNGAKSYLLIKGDLNGIQDFINAGINLSVVGGGTDIAKRLRGKSFFVSILADFLAESLLRNLNYDIWNLLFAGGGHFNIIVADTPENLNLIREWEKETQLHLHEKLGGRLSLVLSIQKCGDDLLRVANSYFSKVNQARDRDKFRLSAKYLSELFEVKEKTKSYGNEHFGSLGEWVPKSKILLYIIGSKPLGHDSKSEPQFIISSFQNEYLFIAEDIAMTRRFLEENKDAIEKAHIITLNNTDFLQKLEGLPVSMSISYGFRLVGNHTPKSANNKIKTFEEITEKVGKNGRLMYNMMAAMRLDVDNLGHIFASGLPAPASLEQVAALSREMSYFFSGYFNVLAAKKNIYVVYSGGDDAFVVGHWWDIMHFARDLQQRFNDFVEANPSLCFSAGIFTCDAHYPVAKFSEDAKYLLDDDAKKHPGKNRISLFNHNVSWEIYSDLLDFGDKVTKYAASENLKESEKLAKSLVNRLLILVKNSFYEKTELDENKKWVKRGYLKPENFYRNLANLHYLLARQEDKSRDQNESLEDNKIGLEGDVIRFILKVFKESNSQVNSKKIAANDLKIALNYALYQLRQPSEK